MVFHLELSITVSYSIGLKISQRSNMTPSLPRSRIGKGDSCNIWVVVKIVVPFWNPIIIRHLIFRVNKKGPLF